MGLGKKEQIINDEPDEGGTKSQAEKDCNQVVVWLKPAHHGTHAGEWIHGRDGGLWGVDGVIVVVDTKFVSGRLALECVDGQVEEKQFSSR